MDILKLITAALRGGAFMVLTADGIAAFPDADKCEEHIEGLNGVRYAVVRVLWTGGTDKPEESPTTAHQLRIESGEAGTGEVDDLREQTVQRYRDLLAELQALDPEARADFDRRVAKGGDLHFLRWLNEAAVARRAEGEAGAGEGGSKHDGGSTQDSDGSCHQGCNTPRSAELAHGR